MKILIIAGGTAPSASLLKRELETAQIVICADSGADCLYSLKIVPDFLIGDFDSINSEALEFFKAEGCFIEQYPKEKDLTDSEIALDKAFNLGPSEIVFLGCTGHRLDHVLGNLGLLLKCCQSNVKAYLMDDYNTIFVSSESLKLHGKKGELFSLCSFGESVRGLSVSGAKYPLSNYHLVMGDPRTISNEFQSKEVEITFSSGILMIIKSTD